MLYLVVFENTFVQIGVSKLSLPLVASVAADQSCAVDEQEISHHVLSLEGSEYDTQYQHGWV